MTRAMRPIVDGHLDLAMNALSYERDQTLRVDAIRAREAACEPVRRSTTSIAEMAAQGVGLCVTTLIARVRDAAPERPADRRDLDYPVADMAHAAAHAHLAYYRLLERRGEVAIVADRASLESCWSRWAEWSGGPAPGPVGLILTMEGADPITEPAEVHAWHAAGLRSILLGHYGSGPYAMGTLPAETEDTGLTSLGRDLLAEMEGLAIGLDLTHLSDRSFFETIDLWGGPVLASHSNCRVLADSVRQLTDEQIDLVVARGGVIGMAFHYAMLESGWGKGLTAEQVGLEAVVRHIDHVCQRAGNCRHVGLGTDLDGGFGAEATPRGIETVADLHRLADLLAGRGYDEADIDAVLHGNWLRFWRETLPLPQAIGGDIVGRPE